MPGNASLQQQTTANPPTERLNPALNNQGLSSLVPASTTPAVILGIPRISPANRESFIDSDVDSDVGSDADSDDTTDVEYQEPVGYTTIPPPSPDHIYWQPAMPNNPRFLEGWVPIPNGLPLMPERSPEWLDQMMERDPGAQPGDEPFSSHRPSPPVFPGGLPIHVQEPPSSPVWPGGLPVHFPEPPSSPVWPGGLPMDEHVSSDNKRRREEEESPSDDSNKRVKIEEPGDQGSTCPD